MAEFVRTAPFGVFLFLFGIPALLALAMGAAAVWARRNAKALAALPETTVDLVKDGPCLATGKVAEGAGVRAPLTGRACAWCESIVDEAVRTTQAGSNDANYDWRRTREETSGKAIRFEWNGAGAGVPPDGATVFHSGWSEWYGPGPEPEDRDPEIRPGTEGIAERGRFEVMTDPGRRFRYRERYVFAGDPLFVLGEAKRGKGGVRIGPAGGRPFLISTRSPEAIGTESGLAMRAGIGMAALFGLVAAFVAWLRLG